MFREIYGRMYALTFRSVSSHGGLFSMYRQ